MQVPLSHRQALAPFMLSIFELHVHLLPCTIEGSAWFQLKKSTCIASMLQQHFLQQSLQLSLQNTVYIVSVAIHANAHKYMTSHHTPSHTHTHTHAHTHTHRYTDTHTHTHRYTDTEMHVTHNMHVHTHVHVLYMNSIVAYSISYATCHLISMAT